MADGVIEVESYADTGDARNVYFARASYRGFRFTFVAFLTDAEARSLDDPGSEVRARLRAAYDAKVAELVAVT